MQATATSLPIVSKWAVAVLAPVLVASCAPVDADQARLCRIAAVALEPPGRRIAVLRAAASEAGITVHYRSAGTGGDPTLHAAACRFALGRRDDLVGLVRDGKEVAGATVYLLNHYFVHTPEGRAADPGPP